MFEYVLYIYLHGLLSKHSHTLVMLLANLDDEIIQYLLNHL